MHTSFLVLKSKVNQFRPYLLICKYGKCRKWYCDFSTVWWLFINKQCCGNGKDSTHKTTAKNMIEHFLWLNNTKNLNHNFFFTMVSKSWYIFQVPTILIELWCHEMKIVSIGWSITQRSWHYCSPIIHFDGKF